MLVHFLDRCYFHPVLRVVKPGGAGPGRTDIPLIGGRGLRLSVAVVATATAATAFTALRLAVGAFLAPKLYFIFLGALDASLLHFTIVFDLCLRKFTIFSEDDVETQTENTKCDKDQYCYEKLHLNFNR